MNERPATECSRLVQLVQRQSGKRGHRQWTDYLTRKATSNLTRKKCDGYSLSRYLLDIKTAQQVLH